MRSTILQLTLAVIITSSLSMSASACDGANASSYKKASSVRYVVVPRSYSHRETVRKPVHPEPRNYPTMESGIVYRLTGGAYGQHIGSVELNLGGLEVECDIQTWSAHEVTFMIPAFRLKRSSRAELKLIDAHGRTLTTKTVVLNKPVAVETLEPVPTPPVTAPAIPLAPEVVPAEVPVIPTVLNNPSVSDDTPPAPSFEIADAR